MKKNFLLSLGCICILLITSCTTNSTTSGASAAILEQRVDSLQTELDKMKSLLAPGLADLMYRNYTYVQNIAGEIEKENWEYAAFHLHEMEEIFEKIVNMHNRHDELVQPADAQLQSFIFPAFEELEKAVQEKNKTVAKQAHLNLMNGCNKCHVANNHAFIVIE
ncbi:MAG: hypothetical protein ACK4IY_04135 [Chitinophagales bacterium]